MVILYNVDGYDIFVGEDQFENEELFKYSAKYQTQMGNKIVWHHVESFSSAHAYVILHEGETEVPQRLRDVCCQIVKQGSIEGVKKPSVEVVTTVCTNLAKTKGMNPGQVSFSNRSLVKIIRGVRKDQSILNMLEKQKKKVPLESLNKELELLIKGKRKHSKQQSYDPDFSDSCDSDDSLDEKPAKKPNMRDMLADLPKAEFDPNMEDDFM